MFTKRPGDLSRALWGICRKKLDEVRAGAGDGPGGSRMIREFFTIDHSALLPHLR